jgi:hypothetical protein
VAGPPAPAPCLGFLRGWRMEGGWMVWCCWTRHAPYFIILWISYLAMYIVYYLDWIPKGIDSFAVQNPKDHGILIRRIHLTREKRTE